MSESRRGWRERVEPGVYRSHRLACPSSRDRRAGRRCACALQVSVPGPSGGSTLVSLEPGASLADARKEKRRRMGGRPLPVDVHGPLPRSVHELAVLYLRDREPLLAPATIRTIAEGYRLPRLLETGSSVHATARRSPGSR
jgi:hypothetical protein